MSVFNFIDEVTEVKKNESLTAFYTLKGSEEFLQDHFSGFPVMPGVLMLESVKQAASALMQRSAENGPRRYRLAKVDGVRFGQFIRPGDTLKIAVQKSQESPLRFQGKIDRFDKASASSTAKVLSVNLTLAPVGLESGA